MGDSVYLPGLNDKYKSQDAINKIMETKRVKLKEMQDKNTGIKDKKTVLNDIRDKTVALQNYAKKLYGVDSPFDNKISISSDPNAFTATVKRNAEVGDYKIKIINKAQAHKIASMSLNKNYKIPQGEYNFQIGKNKVKIAFNGGSVEEFAKKIENQSKNKLKTTVTWDTLKTQVLILEAEETGKDNVIFFLDDKTKTVFKDMDFYEDIASYDRLFKIGKNNLVNLSDIKNSPMFLDNDTLVVDRNEKIQYNLNEKIPYKDRLIMEIDLRLEELDPNKVEELNPAGPDFSKSGEINIFNIQVEGESTLVNIPEYKKPEKPKIVVDDHYLEIITNKRTIKLDELEVGKDKKTLRFDMNKIIDKDEQVSALILKNSNTYKRLEVSNIHFFDEGSELKMRFKHEISKPQDALLVFDGVQIERSNNTIEDLIKGVNLYVLDKTSKEESLKIDRDYEGITKSITEFLQDFNKLIEIVNKETSTNADDEGKKGKFIGDYGLVAMVSKLRTIMMNSYPTSFGDELALLAQIGISTNSSGFGSMNKDKLKGLLEVNEDRFVEKMEKYPIGVKELFGKDTDGDLIIDSGIGYQMDIVLKTYTMRAQGFFDTRNATYDIQMDSTKKEIKEYEAKLTEEERKLKEQFYKMEKAASELEDNKKKFDNFNK